jgi:hypothetical protein
VDEAPQAQKAPGSRLREGSICGAPVLVEEQAEQTDLEAAVAAWGTGEALPWGEEWALTVLSAYDAHQRDFHSECLLDAA